MKQFLTSDNHNKQFSGSFSMAVLSEKFDGSSRRSVNALINPNKNENWTDVPSEIGLVAMARAYRETYYRAPPDLEVIQVVQQTHIHREDFTGFLQSNS